MKDKIELFKTFKNEVIEFLESLIALFPNNNEMIRMRIMFHDQVPIEDMIISLMNTILPYKDMIINRDENFFLKNNDIFPQTDKSKVIQFRELWNSDQLDDDDKEQLWNWFSLFLKRIENYRDLQNGILQ